MNQITRGISNNALKLALQYMESNPEENIPKVVDLLLTFIKTEDSRKKLIAAKRVMQESDNPYRNTQTCTFTVIQ
jgi:hypothetical protein